MNGEALSRSLAMTNLRLSSGWECNKTSQQDNRYHDPHFYRLSVTATPLCPLLFNPGFEYRPTYELYFTFSLPCIVKDFFLNNQPDALIIQIYSVIKLYMFRASPLPIIRSFPLYIRQSHQKLHETYQCRMYSGKVVMVGKGDARNM